MRTRMLAILLLITMMLPFAPCYAAASDDVITTIVEAEHVRDGGLENEVEAWSKIDKTAGDGTVLERTTEKAYEGSRSIKMTGVFQDRIGQRIHNLVGEREYEFSCYMYSPTDQPLDFYTKFEITDADKNYLTDATNYPITSYVIHRTDVHNQWKKVSYKFTTPPDAYTGMFYIMIKSKGTIYLDNISIMGAAVAEVENTLPNYVDALINATETEKSLVTTEHFRDSKLENENGSWSAVDVEADDGTVIERTTEKFYEGTRSMKIHGVARDRIGQRTYDLVGNQEYEFSCYVYSPSGQPLDFYTKYEMIDDSGLAFSPTECNFATYVTHTVDGHDAWKKVSCKFTTPPRAAGGMFYIQLKSAGTLYFDNISLVGAADASQDYKFDEVPANSPELLGDFADMENGWNDYDEIDSGDSEYITYYTDPTYGKVGRITQNGDINTYILKVVPVEEGATYQASVMLKTDAVHGRGPRMKIEYFDDTKINYNKQVGMDQSPILRETFGSWQKAGFKFTTPENAKCVALFYRLYDAGDISFAKATLHKLHDEPLLSYQTVAFEYADTQNATAYVRMNTTDIPEGAKLKFTLLDLDSVTPVLEEEVAVQNEVYWHYPTSKLAIKNVFYTLKMQYIKADGTVIYEESQPVAKVDRPTRITPDGFFLGYNNEKITPVMGYHVPSTDWAQCKEAGINVMQVNPGGNIAVLKNYLDAAQQAGVYLAVVLYDNGYAAGHPRNIQRTKAMVETFKDHPALFAWMVQDEPLWNDPYCYPQLYDAYALIHQLDSSHPVYTCEGSIEEGIAITGICDVRGADPYPANRSGDRLNVVSNTILGNSTAAEGKKPVIAILQAYDYSKIVEGGFKPDDDSMRNMAYQAFFAGATGIGYYPINNEESTLWDTDFYDAVLSFNKTELKDAVGAFVTKEYPTVAEQSGVADRVWYKLYKKDGELYLIVINREENASATAAISLPGTQAFVAECADCSGSDDIIGKNTINLTLPPHAARKYKINTNVSSFTYTDKDGATSESISKGGKIQPRLTYKAGATPETISILVGQYKKALDGSDYLADVYKSNLTIGAGQVVNGNIGQALTVPESEDITYKLMLWEGLKPITNSAVTISTN